MPAPTKRAQRDIAPWSTARRIASRPGQEQARPRGIPATGQIVRLLVGQGCGFIRLTDHRDIYFHRGDVSQGTPFNGFAVGDLVAFELLDDRVSGPRALEVKRQSARRP